MFVTSLWSFTYLTCVIFTAQHSLTLITSAHNIVSIVAWLQLQVDVYILNQYLISSTFSFSVWMKLVELYH